MSIRIIKHYSGSVKLPITQYNGSPYNFEGIIFGNNIARINGYAGGPYAAESTNIDVSENNISVYDTKHHIDHTQFYNQDLIKDFVNFFKENIDIDYYESQPTDTGMVMLSSTDTDKLRQWASSHKFAEKVNSSKIFENILQEGWVEDKAAKTFEEYSKIRGYDAKEDLMQFAYYGSNSNFKHFAINVAKLLPKDCDLRIGESGMAISVTYKGYGVGKAYRSVNDREVHCFNIEKPVIRFGIKNGSLNTEGAAKRFIDYLQPNITKAEIKAQEHEAREIKRNANADRIKQVRPDDKDLQRAKDAWNKAFHISTSTMEWNFSLGLNKYYDLWRQQNDKITDTAKADRRINAFYNFLLSQEPNIPDSYKFKFDNVKNRFEDRMKDINLHESVNSRIIFDKVLNEKWQHWKGHEPRDGMTGGSWESWYNCDKYEKAIRVELDGDHYLVYLTMEAELSQGYDETVGEPYHCDVEIGEDDIQLKDIKKQFSKDKEVINLELRDKLFELAKKQLLDNLDEYFENDFYEEPEPPDPPDYEPDDF